MKKHTRVFYGVFFAVLVLAMPLAAQARPFGPGPGGPGGWYQSLPQEQRDAVSKIMREHQDKAQPIHDQLWIKSQTLDALAANPKAEPKDIQNLVAEMAALRTQLREERKAFADRVKKETGVDMPGYGYGAGYGMGGRYGMGDCGCGYGGAGFRGDHPRRGKGQGGMNRR